MFGNIRGSGTYNNPYLIEDGYDLIIMKNLVSNNNIYYFKLVNDIDMEKLCNENRSFFGIKNFHGVFDGNFKTIKNLVLRNTAIFSDIIDIDNNDFNTNILTVKNLKLVNITTYGDKAILFESIRFPNGTPLNLPVTLLENVYIQANMHLANPLGTYSGLIIGNYSAQFNGIVYKYKNCYFDITVDKNINSVDANCYINNNSDAYLFKTYIENTIFNVKLTNNAYIAYPLYSISKNYPYVLHNMYINKVNGELSNFIKDETLATNYGQSIDNNRPIQYVTTDLTHNKKLFYPLINYDNNNCWLWDINIGISLKLMYNIFYLLYADNKYYTYNKELKQFVYIADYINIEIITNFGFVLSDISKEEWIYYFKNKNNIELIEIHVDNNYNKQEQVTTMEKVNNTDITNTINYISTPISFNNEIFTIDVNISR